MNEQRARYGEEDKQGAQRSHGAADGEAARGCKAEGVQDARDQQDEAAHVDIPGRHAEHGEACDTHHEDRHVLDRVQLYPCGAVEFGVRLAGGQLHLSTARADIHL